MSDLSEFMKLTAALEPWRQQLVFVGGWAHRLYRQHPLADPPAYMPLATKDADVAFADSARLEGSIREALIEAGFKEDLFGTHRPPISSYTLGEPPRFSWRLFGLSHAAMGTAGPTSCR